MIRTSGMHASVELPTAKQGYPFPRSHTGWNTHKSIGGHVHYTFRPGFLLVLRTLQWNFV